MSICRSMGQHNSNSIYGAMRISDIPHGDRVIVTKFRCCINNDQIKCIVNVHDPCPELLPRATNKPSQTLTTRKHTPPQTTHPTSPRIQSHKTPPCPTKISRTSAARACSSCSNKAKAAAEEAAEAARAQSKNQDSETRFYTHSFKST
jgi:hypothetical protein